MAFMCFVVIFIFQLLTSTIQGHFCLSDFLFYLFVGYLKAKMQSIPYNLGRMLL